MPDGDRVYRKPQPRYRAALQQLAEGQSLEEVAWQIAGGITKDIRDYGEGPRQLTVKIAQLCQDISLELSARHSVDWPEASWRIDQEAQQIWGHRRGIPIAIEACKEHLLEFEENQTTDSFQLDLLRKYIWRIYDANFAECLPLDSLEYEYDPVQLQARLTELRPYMIRYIEDLARRIEQRESVNRLQKPKRPEKLPEIDYDHLDEDDLLEF